MKDLLHAATLTPSPPPENRPEGVFRDLRPGE
jgi:hypothetical protein